jgi:hypothetical protein
MTEGLTQILLVTLLGVTGFLGARIFVKLDKIQECLKDKERDLRLEIAKLWTELRKTQVVVGYRADVHDKDY